MSSDTPPSPASLFETGALERPVDFDEEAFFTTADGEWTLVGPEDLDAAVENEYKDHYTETDRYWVNKPYAFVVIYHSERENEARYYVVEPHLSPVEDELLSYLPDKLSDSIKWTEVAGKPREQVIREETQTILESLNIYDEDDESGAGLVVEAVKDHLANFLEKQAVEGEGSIDPTPRDEEGKRTKLSDEQVEKLIYYLRRDLLGYRQIDAIKHDINVEDIFCNGYDTDVFIQHTEHEQLITNVSHGREELDDFVIHLAKLGGKGISKRQPDVDATLPDGSRAILVLGEEISDKGTNYTIRQFKDVPFTPVDLINWGTFSLEEMAYLWMAVEHGRSVIFAGGTASGKTTTLNAISLFVPPNKRIVSIEDTRELEIPQQNWTPSKTRESYREGGQGDIAEYELLENALRQRPDYIIMGEVRGEEGQSLMQAMNTGHTVYTTFHADNVGEVIKRFTTNPINVSKSLFGALDLIVTQEQVRVDGRPVRRATELTEVKEYNTDKDEFRLESAFEWLPMRDEHRRQGISQLETGIQHRNGWSDERFDIERLKREVVLAYLIKAGFNDYGSVAATIQGFINDNDAILELMARGELEENIENLRKIKNVDINVNEELEELVPRPFAGEEELDEADEILREADFIFSPDYDEPGVDVEAALLSDDDGESDAPANADLDELMAAAEEPNPDATGDLVAGMDDEGDGEAEFGYHRTPPAGKADPDTRPPRRQDGASDGAVEAGLDGIAGAALDDTLELSLEESQSDTVDVTETTDTGEDDDTHADGLELTADDPADTSPDVDEVDQDEPVLDAATEEMPAPFGEVDREDEFGGVDTDDASDEPDEMEEAGSSPTPIEDLLNGETDSPPADTTAETSPGHGQSPEDEPVDGPEAPNHDDPGMETIVDEILGDSDGETPDPGDTEDYGSEFDEAGALESEVDAEDVSPATSEAPEPGEATDDTDDGGETNTLAKATTDTDSESSDTPEDLRSEIFGDDEGDEDGGNGLAEIRPGNLADLSTSGAPLSVSESGEEPVPNTTPEDERDDGDNWDPRALETDVDLDPEKCQQIKLDGSQCQNDRPLGEDYCPLHPMDYDEEELIKARLDRPNCSELKDDGSRCSRVVEPGSDYCWQHPLEDDDVSEGEAEDFVFSAGDE